MPKQNIIATNFTSGEVSPLVRGRVDAQKYANGLETCENFIVRPQGPIWRRSGTQFLGTTKFPTQKSIIVPFEYSDTKGYFLEFGVGYVQIWQSNGKLYESTNQSAAAINADGSSGMTRLYFTQTAMPGYGYGKTASLSVSYKTTTTSQDTIRLTTSVPHTLRTGSLCSFYVLTPTTFVVAYSGAFTVTRITDYSFDLNGSSAMSTWLRANPGSWDRPHCAVNPILVGDAFFSNVTLTAPSLVTGNYVVATDATYDRITTNIPYVSGGGPTTTGNAFIFPIELSTDYGFLPPEFIDTSAGSGSGEVILYFASGHSFANGDTVEVSKTNSSADGVWVVKNAASLSITLTGSIHHSTAATGAMVRKYVGDSQLADLKFAQSADVLYVMHPNHPVCKITRLSNDGDRYDWLFSQVSFKDGPYLPLNSLAPQWDESTPSNGSIFKDVYLELSNYLHTATVKSSVAFTASAALRTGAGGDQNGYIEYRDGDQWRLAKLGPTPTGTTATIDIIDNVLLHLDETVKLKGTKRVVNALGISQKITYDAGSPNLTPSIPGAATQSKVDPNNAITSNKAFTEAAAVGTLTSNLANTFSQTDVGKFVRYFDSGANGAAGTALSATSQRPTWAQIVRVGATGNTCTHELPIVRAKTYHDGTGNFVISNEKRTADVRSYKAGAPFDAFVPTDVGRHIRIGWGGRWTWGKITTVWSTVFVSVELYNDVPRDPHNAANLAGATNGALTSASSTGRSYDWRLGAWSKTTGYPSCGVFHEQRLWFGRTNTEPQTIWGSISGDFENFSPTELDSTVLEDNAVSFAIASTKANPIKWMVSGPAITVGTTGGEWQVKSSSMSSEPITPLNIVVVPHTSHGSHNRVQPIRLGNSVLFADRPGSRIRELVYDFSVDALTSRDLTYLSEHMLRESSGAIYSAYQQEPNNICWYVLSDGTLAAVTINKDQEIVAWHHHTIADATVESISVIPSTDSSKDNVYAVVKRGSNRYVELLQNDFYPNGTDKKGMRFLDGAIVFPSSSFNGTKISGLTHLEGKTVTVSINGTLLGNYTVSSGVVTIASQTNAELVVGLPYTSTAKSLPPEGGSAFGVSQGKIKKLAKYNVRLLNSLAMDYGFNSNGQSLNSITNLHENGTSTDFYTGTKELIPNNPYDAESQWTLSTNKPYPLNILSVTLTVETGE